MSVFDGFRARLDRILADSGGQSDGRAYVSGLRDAVIEAKAAVSSMRDQLGITERELAAEERQLADAERRGSMAEEIGDAETAAVAARFATKHRERAGVLERKLAVQREDAVDVRLDVLLAAAFAVVVRGFAQVLEVDHGAAV